MLPDSGCVAWMMRCMVKSPDRKGDDHGTAAACEVGPGRPRRAGTPLPDYPPGWEQELVRVADLDPHQVGVPSALWSCRLLADYLAGVTGYRAGIESVRIALHRAGFVCKRPAGCCPARPRPSRGGQKTCEGGGAACG